MAILSDNVAGYLERLRPEPPPLHAEIEELAAREGVPIVQWETGRLLAALVRALDPALVLEVGTAIGYSTLHMAEALGRGRIVTLERDPRRLEQARDHLERGGVLDRVEIVAGDALETIPALEGPFDLLFLDASKGEYARYLELAEGLASDRALLLVDNVLMSGEAALPAGAPTRWSAESLAAGRALAAELMRSPRWLASVLPVGDGVLLAARA